MTSHSHPFRQYIGMCVMDVHDHPGGVVAELGHPSRTTRTMVLLEGCTSTADLTEYPPPWSEADDDQAQIDIGDDRYEQERYSEHEIDIVPDEPAFPWRPDR